jgi:hypothetical protein
VDPHQHDCSADTFCRVCLRFTNVVGPLLDNLAAHTGYKISILVGRVKKEDGKVDIESAS